MKIIWTKGDYGNGIETFFKHPHLQVSEEYAINLVPVTVLILSIAVIPLFFIYGMATLPHWVLIYMRCVMGAWFLMILMGFLRNL